MLITTSEVAKRLGLRPLARIHGHRRRIGPAVHADRCHPGHQKVLQRAGLTLADIDLFEVNEAFAPVVLSWAQDTGADLAKTNVNGGAIAIGHPARRQRRADHDHDGQRVGAARRPLRAADDVRRIGMANATIIERL